VLRTCLVSHGPPRETSSAGPNRVLGHPCIASRNCFAAATVPKPPLCATISTTSLCCCLAVFAARSSRAPPVLERSSDSALRFSGPAVCAIRSWARCLLCTCMAFHWHFGRRGVSTMFAKAMHDVSAASYRQRFVGGRPPRCTTAIAARTPGPGGSSTLGRAGVLPAAAVAFFRP